MSHAQSNSIAAYPNLLAALAARAQRNETTIALRYLLTGDIDGRIIEWDFPTLDRRARAIAHTLQQQGQSGKMVLLVHPPGVEFIEAFLGCLYAGAIAVPVYPPSPANLAVSIANLLAIVQDCGARAALTTPEFKQMIVHMVEAFPAITQLTWLAPDASSQTAPANWAMPTLEADQIAFLQYTSGSTGQPKGVVLRHDNLWFNLCAIDRAYPAQHTVSWLPVYHDMGLIGSLLTNLAAGTPVTLMPPHEFLRRPTRWLRAISHYRADRTTAPNFGYMLAAGKSDAKELAGLDLSCLAVAIVGAEPISPHMLSTFSTTFARCGFDPTAFAPAYGMAEATLLVSTRRTPALPIVRRYDSAALTRRQALPVSSGGTQLVGCGTSIPGQRIVIADPDTLQALPDCTIGEILIQGPSLAREYWNHPDSQLEVFQCPIDGMEGSFMRTGDLGFLDQEELFVTGRIKDLIIVRGKNHIPSDIEHNLEKELAHALRPGRVVAAPVQAQDGETVLLLAEVKDEVDAAQDRALMETIVRTVATIHGIEIHSVALLEKGGLPRTSSGKLQRRAARDAFVAGTLAVRAHADFSAKCESGTVPNLPHSTLHNTVPSAAATPLYRSFDDLYNRLDKRSSNHLFDLETDIDWHKLDLPGIYLPAKFLATLGFDLELFAANPEAHDLFQWATAISTCRTFEILEWGFSHFCAHEREQLGASRSIDNLYAEEQKHIRMFRRYAAHLEQQRPKLVPAFNAAFEQSMAFLRNLFETNGGATLHYQTWLDTLMFEGFSLYFAHQLASTNEAVQPVWLRCHQLHAREEAHHLTTVCHYESELVIPEPERQQIAQTFLAQRGFEHVLGVAAPLQLLCQEFGDLGWRNSNGEQLSASFLHEMHHSKFFLSLRRALHRNTAEASAKGALPAALPRPEIVFVLSSERAGSTLLRVMLSGHPELFSPPEMNLLPFETLAQRDLRLPVRQQNGLTQAWAELCNMNQEQAQHRLQQLAETGTTGFEMYEKICQSLDTRILIDKSPMYSRDLAALQRAHAYFGTRARYIYLSRHPYAVIDSYARIGLHRMLNDDIPSSRDPYELGEMGWTLSNRTLQAFLAEIPEQQVCRLRFEDLAAAPQAQMSRLCGFIGVPWRAETVLPYLHGQMLAHASGDALVGDPKFYQWQKIEASQGQVWQTIRLPRLLGPQAQLVAAETGYSLPHELAAELAAKSAENSSGAAGTAEASTSADATPAARAKHLLQVRQMTGRILADASNRPELDLQDDTKLADLGLSSLELIRLTDRIERELNLPLDAMTLYNYPSFGELVAHLAQPGTLAQASAETNLADEVRLDPSILAQIAARKQASNQAGKQASHAADNLAPESDSAPLFLTGATGFLGAYLLRDLANSSQRTLHCLVRAANQAEGLARIRSNLTYYGIWQEAYAARIVIETGDLGQARFGLPAERFDWLAENIGLIYHNGAFLRFDQPYAMLKAPNVEGTHDVIRLAAQGRIKPLHYVSTNALFDSASRDAQVDETTPTDNWRGVHLGYAQSKWVAERMVALAGQHGLPVTIYRPAGIAGDQTSGAWNTGDLVCRVLKTCILMQAAPRLALTVDMAPVNYVSQGLVWLSQQLDATGKVYHLNMPRPISWDKLVGWMRFRGYPMSDVSYEAWLAQLQGSAHDESHPLATLLPFFTKPVRGHQQSLFELRQQRPIIKCEMTAATLAPAGIVCPALGHDLLSIWFDFMVQDGFLPAAQG